MKDLSLHVLDIVQNSISAQARNIEIFITQEMERDKLIIEINDDGKGIGPELLPRVTDPYFTSRTTRKVGLGLPLFRQNAEMTGGSFSIASEPGKGTRVKAVFGHSHLDRQPLGDMAGVIMILVGANPELDFIYRHQVNDNFYEFNTVEVREALEGLPLNDPLIIRRLKEMIAENLAELYSGKPFENQA